MTTKLQKAIDVINNPSVALEKDNVLVKAKFLSNLLLEKIKIIESMNKIQYRHNNLSVSEEDAEDWLFGLPAKSMKDLAYAGSGTNRTCLNDMRVRESYKRTFSDMEKKLSVINTDIKIATIDLLISKANATQ